MITIQCWNPTDPTLRSLAPESALPDLRAQCEAGCILWIDLAEPTAEEERFVFEQCYKIHPLSVEDVARLRREPDSLPHLPKVEEFPDYLFVIVNPLTPDFAERVGQLRNESAAPFLTQLSAVVTQNLLITHHFRPLACIDQLNGYLQRHSAQMERGPDYLFHLILDCTVDEFVPVLDAIDVTLDDMETAVMENPGQALYARLLRLKREIILLRKTLIAEREVLVRMARGEFSLVNERETVYYRNVYDHLVRFTELIESSREMVSDLMQTFLSAQANRLNQIMKVLTMISTVVMPMTLIAGIYGMNFKRLVPDTDNEHGFAIALGIMAASGLISLVFFRWRGWI